MSEKPSPISPEDHATLSSKNRPTDLIEQMKIKYRRSPEAMLWLVAYGNEPWYRDLTRQQVSAYQRGDREAASAIERQIESMIQGMVESD